MFERSPDENDMASNHEINHTEKSVKFVQARLAKETHPDFDGEHCLDCGDVMLAARLADGRIRCTACQTFIETKSKMYR